MYSSIDSKHRRWILGKKANSLNMESFKKKRVLYQPLKVRTIR